MFNDSCGIGTALAVVVFNFWERTRHPSISHAAPENPGRLACQLIRRHRLLEYGLVGTGTALDQNRMFVYVCSRFQPQLSYSFIYNYYSALSRQGPLTRFDAKSFMLLVR